MCVCAHECHVYPSTSTAVVSLVKSPSLRILFVIDLLYAMSAFLKLVFKMLYVNV